MEGLDPCDWYVVLSHYVAFTSLPWESWLTRERKKCKTLAWHGTCATSLQVNMYAHYNTQNNDSLTMCLHQLLHVHLLTVLHAETTYLYRTASIQIV